MERRPTSPKRATSPRRSKSPIARSKSPIRRSKSPKRVSIDDAPPNMTWNQFQTWYATKFPQTRKGELSQAWNAYVARERIGVPVVPAEIVREVGVHTGAKTLGRMRQASRFIEESTRGLTGKECYLKPSKEEFASYLGDIAVLGTRATIRIFSPKTNRVVSALLRGSAILELLEFTASDSGVEWIEKVDEARKYSKIPELSRFGRTKRPPIDTDVGIRYLQQYYAADDYLDVDTLYQIALRRGTCADVDQCIYAKTYVARILNEVYDVFLRSISIGAVKWYIPKLEDQASWEDTDLGDFEDFAADDVTNMTHLILVRIYADGYDPLELRPDSGAIPTPEQGTWNLDMLENVHDMVIYTVDALHATYSRYFGIPRLEKRK